jgi:hypothetical protein
MKVEIERNGKRQEVTGWRKWALGITVIIVAALLVAAAVLLAFGVTLTIGAILLVTIPIAIVVAFLWSLTKSKPT